MPFGHTDGGAAPPAACENCGTVLAGEFCHACGQRAGLRPLALRPFLAGASSDAFSLDSRLLRTLRALLAHPGLLTREFIAGHRVRYVHPFQVYLIAAGLFFIVCTYRPIITFDPATRTVASALTAITVGGELGAQDVAELAARGISVEVFAERFRASTSAHLPTFLIGSVLVFSLSLALFYVRSGRGFLEHVVFSLHWAAFYFLLMSLVQLVPGPRQGWSPARFAEMLSFLLSWVYLVLALKRVYGQSLGVTLAKSAILIFWFTTLLFLWVVSVIVWSMERI